MQGSESIRAIISVSQGGSKDTPRRWHLPVVTADLLPWLETVLFDVCNWFYFAFNFLDTIKKYLIPHLYDAVVNRHEIATRNLHVSTICRHHVPGGHCLIVDGRPDTVELLIPQIFAVHLIPALLVLVHETLAQIVYISTISPPRVLATSLWM